MFTEPQTITIDGTGNALRRTAFSPGKFQLPDGSLTLEITQSATRTTERFNVRLSRVFVAPDPLNPAVQRVYTSRYWFGSDGPLNGVGISDTQANKDLTGLLNWGLVSANQIALRAGEA